MLNSVQSFRKRYFSGRIKCTTSKKFIDSSKKSQESGKVIVTVNGDNSSDDIQFTYKVMDRFVGLPIKNGMW